MSKSNFFGPGAKEASKGSTVHFTCDFENRAAWRSRTRPHSRSPCRLKACCWRTTARTPGCRRDRQRTDLVYVARDRRVRTRRGLGRQDSRRRLRRRRWRGRRRDRSQTGDRSGQNITRTKVLRISAHLTLRETVSWSPRPGAPRSQGSVSPVQARRHRLAPAPEFGSRPVDGPPRRAYGIDTSCWRDRGLSAGYRGGGGAASDLVGARRPHHPPLARPTDRHLRWPWRRG